MHIMTTHMFQSPQRVTCSDPTLCHNLYLVAEGNFINIPLNLHGLTTLFEDILRAIALIQAFAPVLAT